MSEVIITRLKEQHIPQMKEIMEDDNMIFNEKKLQNFIKQKDNLGFIAIADNKIVGFAYAYSLLRPDNDKSMFYLHSIGILPAYQEKKIGTRLMEYIVEFARVNNFSEIFVITDKSNIRACNLYARQGMKNDYEDEIVFVKNFKS